MFRRAVFYSSPLIASIGGLYAGVTIANRNNVPSSTETNAGEVQKVGKITKAPHPVTIHSFGTEEIKPWDYNWDKRDPFSLVDVNAYEAASEEQRKEMISKHTPTKVRNILLIRHGQYDMDSEKNELTSLGREQADILGKRLAEFEMGKGKKFNRCFVSTKQRAKETAEIALQHLPHVSEIQKRCDLLREGAPCRPEPGLKSWRPPNYFYEDGARIEAAFRKYIHRASPSQKEDTYELYFCHANVIRYFVCRALQFPPEGWLRISLVNSSITWIQIRPNGGLSLLALGDSGHLPSEKATFS